MRALSVLAAVGTLARAGAYRSRFWKDNHCNGNILEPKQRLSKGMHLCDANGYVFGIDHLGRFAAWENVPGATGQIWFPKKKSGVPASYLEMQNDGNLVVYGAESEVIWASGTTQKPGTRLAFSEGVLKIEETNGKTIWSLDLTDLDDDVNGNNFDSSDVNYANCLPQPFSATSYIREGDYICSGQYLFGLDLSGDFSLRRRTGAWNAEKIWSAKTSGDNYAVMQSDGNLVVYRARDQKPMWHSQTHGNEGAKLYLSTDGLAYLADRSGKTIWSHNGDNYEDEFDRNGVSCIHGSVRNERSFHRGEYLCEGSYSFGVDFSGDLSLWYYRDGTDAKIWSAGTSGDVRATKQRDGNLVVYRNGDDRVKWSSKTSEFRYSALSILDGKAKLVSPTGKVVWTTDNNITTCPRLS